MRGQVRIVSRNRGHLGGEPRGEAAFALADTEETLKHALYLYGSVEHDWRGLYMVLDAIADHYGGVKKLLKQGLAPERKIKDFKATADSFKATKLAARHGSTSRGIASPKMTLSEARELIRKLLGAWVAKLA